MELIKARITTSDLIAPGQIGWVYFTEGRVEIAAKVIMNRDGSIFLSLPTARKSDTKIRVVNFIDRDIWLDKNRELVSLFIRQVGDEFIKDKKEKYKTARSKESSVNS